MTSPSKLGEPNDTVCLDSFICILPVGHHDLVPSLSTPLRSPMSLLSLSSPLSPSSRPSPSTCFLNSHTSFHIHLPSFSEPCINVPVFFYMYLPHRSRVTPPLGFGDAAIATKPLIEAAADRFLSMRSTRVIDPGGTRPTRSTPRSQCIPKRPRILNRHHAVELAGNLRQASESPVILRSFGCFEPMSSGRQSRNRIIAKHPAACNCGRRDTRDDQPTAYIELLSVPS